MGSVGVSIALRSRWDSTAISFFGLVVIAHGIYIAIAEHCRWTQDPANLFEVQSSTQHRLDHHARLPPQNLIRQWIFHVGTVFIDLGFDRHHPYGFWLSIALLLWVGYAGVVLGRQTSKQQWGLVAALVFGSVWGADFARFDLGRAAIDERPLFDAPLTLGSSFVLPMLWPTILLKLTGQTVNSGKV